MIKESDLFRLRIEKPENEFCHGKITLEFKQPRVYYGYYVNEYRMRLPEKEQEVWNLREAIRGFMSMIEKELQAAALEATA